MNDIGFEEHKRVNFLVCFSTNSHDIIEAARSICIELATYFAGATLVRAKGFWSDQGSEFLERYAREGIIEEPSVIILVSAPLDNESDGLETIKKLVRSANANYSLGCSNIHVECQVVMAYHFSIEQD